MKVYRYNKKSYFDKGVEVETLPQWEKGIVMFPLTKYINMTNDHRADENEGVAYFVQGQNNESIGRAIFKISDQMFEFEMSYCKHSQDEFKNIDKMFVACFSRFYSKELCEKFDADYVLEGEIDEKMIGFSSVFQIKGKDTRKLEWWQGIVDYKDKTNIEQGTYKDFDDFMKKTIFTKCLQYEDEKEFRIIFDTSQLLQNLVTLPDDSMLKLPFAFSPIKEWKVLPKL